MASISEWQIHVRVICGKKNGIFRSSRLRSTIERPGAVEAYVVLLLFVMFGCQAQPTLQKGVLITTSTTFSPDTLYLAGSDNLDTPVLWVRGNDITLDFQGAMLIGTDAPTQPDQFRGLAIKVEKGRNITIKNLSIKGYKVALWAEGIDSLQLINCDFSYNYRRPLVAFRESENTTTGWLEEGTAAYLQNCNNARLQNLTITGGTHGIILDDCRDGLFFNNTIQFNGGTGIGLHRSSGHRIMHNKLDWNVYAAIVGDAGSNENVVAFNSATHGKYGILWNAGFENSSEKSSTDNLIYANNCSYNQTGMRLNLADSRIIDNEMADCATGVLMQHGVRSTLVGNAISDGNQGIHLDRSLAITLQANTIKNAQLGIQLQPAQTPAVQDKSQYTQEVTVRENRISDTEVAIMGVDAVLHELERNLLVRSGGGELAASRYHQPQQYQVWQAGAAPTNVALAGRALEEDRKAPWSPRWQVAGLPQALANGQDVALSEDYLQGRSYLLKGEWGPYNFQYPSVWLREVNDQEYTLLLLGPRGNWKLTGATGFNQISRKTGAFPATVVAQREEGATVLELQFEYIGPAFTDQFGQQVARGAGIPFSFQP
jgi:parallel beta-helix repeat protein